MESGSPRKSYPQRRHRLTSAAFYRLDQVTKSDSMGEEMTPFRDGRRDKVIMKRGVVAGRHDLLGHVIKTMYTLLPQCMRPGEAVCLLWHSYSRKH